MVLNFKKIFGGIILAIGIGIIGWAIIASYGYFQGERPFPEIFKAPEIKSLSSRPLSESFQIPSQITSQQDIQALLQQEMQQQMQQQIQESINQLIPPNTISQLLNIICWVIFAFLLVSAGAHIADIGIKLIK